MWKHAQNYYNSNEFAKAKDLLRKLLDMADPEIRAKMPMSKVQRMYADSAAKMRPLAASTYKRFSHKSASHFGRYQQYLNPPDVEKTQVGKGTFVYNKNSNTPLLSAANQSSSRVSSGAGGVLVNGPNFSFRAVGPTNIQLNGLSISIPAGATGVLNISNKAPGSGSTQRPGKTPVKYLKPGAATVVPSSGPAPSTVSPTRGPGNFDTGGFHDLDPGFTIHNN